MASLLPGVPKSFQGMLAQSFGAVIRDKKKTSFEGKNYFYLVVDFMGGSNKLRVESENILDSLPSPGTPVRLRGRLVQIIAAGKPYFDLELLHCEADSGEKTAT